MLTRKFIILKWKQYLLQKLIELYRWSQIKKNQKETACKFFWIGNWSIIVLFYLVIFLMLNCGNLLWGHCMQHLLWMKHSWSFVGSIVTIMAAKETSNLRIDDTTHSHWLCTFVMVRLILIGCVGLLGV